MNLVFTFKDNSQMTSGFITEGAKITETFYNELKSADNSASVRIPFNETLSDKIKLNISDNIKVQIKDGNNYIFTGYLRKTVSFSKTQRNQPISLEIVSPAILLDIDYTGNVITYQNRNLTEIVQALLSLTSFSGSLNLNALSNKTIKLFTISEDDNIKEVLNELLFEYGFCYDFDGAGNFYITELFKTVPTTLTQKFNGNNCLNQINQQVKEDKYNRVSIEWTKVDYEENVLIFEDTSGADANNKAHIDIPANNYYLESEDNYLTYDSKYQKVLWITDAKATINYDSKTGITETFTNLGNQGELSIYNSGNSARYITELSVTGSGYFEISTNFTKTGDNGTESQINAKYIQDGESASALAKKLRDYYDYSNFNVTVVSKTKYDLGSYVEVSDSGIGTLKCRIVKRVWDIRMNQYTYTLESVTEYSPVETYTNTQKVTTKPDNGETLRSAVDDLNQRVNGIVTSTTMLSADILSAIIKLDNDGKTISAQDVTTTITLKQSDIDLDFSIGAINLPDGWTYSIAGKQIKFHIAEGISLRSGQFAIPVLYKTVVSEEFYEDANGNQYVDEKGEPYVNQVMSGSYTLFNLYFNYFGDNGGVYLGMYKTLTQIPANCNYGDYFTWGADDTVSSLSYDGKFLRARVYKYIGTGKAYKWEQDTNAEHGQASLSDVLSVANEELKKNNSTVYMFLDHLTANTIYADMIVSNEAFINKITSKVVSIGNLATVGVVEQAQADAEITALNNAMKELGVDTLDNHTIISGGKIKTNLINANAVYIGDLGDGNSISSIMNTKESTSGAQAKADASLDSALIQLVGEQNVRNHTIIQGGKIKTGLISANALYIGDLGDGTSISSIVASKETPEGAQSKANTAQTNAINTASTDATNKSNNAIDDVLKQLVGESNVRNHTIITGGKIYSSLIDVEMIKATQGFFTNIHVDGFFTSNNTPFCPIASVNITYDNDELRIYNRNNIKSVTRLEKGVFKVEFSDSVKLIGYGDEYNGVYVDMYAIGHAHDTFDNGFRNPLLMSINWCRESVKDKMSYYYDKYGHPIVTANYCTVYFIDNNSDQYIDPKVGQIFLFSSQFNASYPR